MHVVVCTVFLQLCHSTQSTVIILFVKIPVQNIVKAVDVLIYAKAFELLVKVCTV